MLYFMIKNLQYGKPRNYFIIYKILVNFQLFIKKQKLALYISESLNEADNLNQEIILKLESVTPNEIF